MYGNKIDNLIILKENNINVPDFIIIKYEDIIKTEIPEIKDVLIHFEPDDEIDDKIIYT